MREFKNWVISFLNRFVDIPGLNEEQEKIVIKGFIELLFSFNFSGKSLDDVRELGKSFKSWLVEFLNSYIQIPFLSEETERVVLEALLTLLLNFNIPNR